MKNKYLIVLVLTISLPILYSFTSIYLESAHEELGNNEHAMVTGEQLFQRNCSACHGFDIPPEQTYHVLMIKKPGTRPACFSLFSLLVVHRSPALAAALFFCAVLRHGFIQILYNSTPNQLFAPF